MTQETKHETLRRILIELIDTRLTPHDPLPSERELMQRHGVSRMTVRRAVEGLARDGRVYRVQGAGTFVADPGKITKSLTFSSFSEDIRARRMKPGGRLLRLESEPAEIDVARDLFLEPGTPVVRVTRLRTADGEPMCLENAWVPEHLVPGLTARGHVESLYDVLEAAGAAPEHADQTISATVVNREQADLLGVPGNFPALRVSRVTHDARGRAVERAVSLYRADRYDYRLSITRSRRT
ncbi:GntR family transcriptional regulator [Nonomuraea sp. KC401]|uniref:GntR family transcriptional regulator n=1 Tax=unclassified Nonomuraea TaxID=2593643 RepID=UPI0010FE6445|nr:MULTISPECIES: GntR family transcriptional regulator [unclassified Nonomuraea]NBE98152.1 UTRA domain-containing protein [Nonomuraea sp. K271]TLF60140.1 GntR family transcriptional regulator [Nonomuraea sp. KC401]